ncbi:MAG: ABC transporter ATP-binding protein/permease [Erysipelotrichaceae bacterium]|nr:ABC transporter ATP-binding protein/permease [Erysipelotrichaceae bacterium]
MIKLLKNFTKKDWLMIFLSFILIFSQVWLELKMPDYMSEITVLVKTEGSKMSDILVQGGYMLLCAFGSLVGAVIVGFLISKLSANFSLNLRKKIFDKVLSLSTNEVKGFNTSSLITRTTNDVSQIEIFIGMGLQLLIKAPITAIWAITKILNKSVEWSIVTAVAVVILLTVIGIITLLVLPRFKIVQKLTDSLNNVTRESLNGIRVIRAFNAEKYQESKFSKVNNDLTNLQLFNQRTFAIMSPMMYLVMNLITLVIYYIGANLIDAATLASKIDIFSNMIVFTSYAMQVIMAFLMLALIFMILPRASVSAKRVNEVLDSTSSVQEGEFNGNTDSKGKIVFKNVSFKYPDAEEYVLKDISFEASPGETVAFIGSTGSGKSTLINLIPRFYDATEGEIIIDDVNIRDYDFKTLYNKLGYVSQKAVIFDGTVKSNITFGESNSKKNEKEIVEAADIALASEFINNMDHTYNSHISSGGTNISGGQKQRLSIARAVARKPEIYIFDDSFSALDYKTDAALRKNLKKSTKDATILIVAQRIGTIMNADKILVLDNGKCVGMGTHKELLKKCSVYKQIALSQLSKEELENER